MKARVGFTLLELAVALAVAGVTLTAGAAAFAALVDRRASLLSDANRDERALAARRLLSAWLSEARHGTAANDGLSAARGARRTPAGEIGDDTLEFVTTATGEQREVRVYVDRAGARAALVADLRASTGDVTRIVLGDDVAGFEARVRTSAFGRRAWLRGWTGGALRPEALELRFRAADGATLAPPLALPLTVVLGAGS